MEPFAQPVPSATTRAASRTNRRRRRVTTPTEHHPTSAARRAWGPQARGRAIRQAGTPRAERRDLALRAPSRGLRCLAVLAASSARGAISPDV